MVDKLLAIDGTSVVVPHYDLQIAEALLPLVLQRGHEFDATDARLEPGEPRECHTNALELSRAGRGTSCNGFGLSEDGLWRSHSWLLEPSGILIETTQPRTSYFGVELEHVGAQVLGPPPSSAREADTSSSHV